MIYDLKESPQHLETLARWHQLEWSNLNPGKSIEQRVSEMQAYLNGQFIPSTFVAVDELLQGSASIVRSDMSNKPELTPWLASVYVEPGSRRRGVGSKLVRHVMKQAKAHGINNLYLFTPDKKQFYHRLGWTEISDEIYHENKITVMKVCL